MTTLTVPAVEKAAIEKILANEEIKSLIAAIGGSLRTEHNPDEKDTTRYHKIIIMTDADVDGMHIRLLLMTFFLQFFPDLVKAGHVYILDTPLFRVRNKKETIYCYSEEEKQAAVAKLGSKIGFLAWVDFYNFQPGAKRQTSGSRQPGAAAFADYPFCTAVYFCKVTSI